MKHQPVRVEAEVFGADKRFDVLASLLGVDRYSAVGRMAELWSICTDQESDLIKPAVAGVVLGCSPAVAGDSLVDAELGEIAEDGKIRVKGCVRRIGWLGRMRNQRRAAGRARAGKATRNKDGTLGASSSKAEKTSSGGPADHPADIQRPAGVAGSEPPAADQRDTSEPLPADQRPTSPPDSGLPLLRNGIPPVGPPRGDASPQAALELESTGPPTHNPGPPCVHGEAALPTKQRRLLAKHRAACLRIWERQDDLRGRFSARKLKATGPRLVRLAKLLEAGATEAECQVVLDVYAAEAERTGSAEWLNGETPWRQANFDRQLGRADAVLSGRAGARASPERRYYQPTGEEDYGDGEIAL